MRRILTYQSIVFALVCGCLGPQPQRRPVTIPGPGQIPAPLPGGQGAPLAVILKPAPREDPKAWANFLSARPHWRANVVLPSAFLTAGSTAPAAFSALVSSGQIEIGLVVPTDPPLALIQDSDAAKASRIPLKLPAPHYAWPEDALGQLALSRNLYRRRWQRDPSGLLVPTGLLAGPEIPNFRKLKLKWGLLPSTSSGAGFFNAGGFLVARPQAIPAGAQDLQGLLKVWRASAAPLEVRTLAEAQVLAAALKSPADASFIHLSEVSTDNLPAWPPPGEVPDFSPWIGEPQENVAWRLLAMTRQALEDYKNSGAADVARLDHATRQIYTAESGRFFRLFGSDFGVEDDTDVEQDFLATLAQVYRLMNQPVPASFLEGFWSAAQNLSAPGANAAAETSYEKEGGALRWKDALKDDRGPGDYFYPNGADYANGSWDIASFEAVPSASDTTFRFEMAVLPNPWRAPSGFSFPMADVYIDVNKLSGAGSQTLLPGRPGQMEAEDAWEYALTVSGWGARLYQYVPGQPPQLAAKLPVRKTGQTFEVSVPGRILRGDPSDWGFGVVIMGAAPSSSGEPSVMPVLAEPGSRQFGGAKPGVEAPPYMDMLVPPGFSQSSILSGYKQGREIVIPALRGG